MFASTSRRISSAAVVSSRSRRHRSFAVLAVLVAALLAASGVQAQTVLKNVAAGYGPETVAINPATNTIYVANYNGLSNGPGGPGGGTGTVTVINGETLTTTTVNV